MQIKIEKLTKEFKVNKERVLALDNISFSVEKGETLGIIGSNGSGKSTLLKIISGVTRQTEGKVVTDGRVSALLELGAGFNPEYTGVENIYLNGSIMGIPKAKISEKLEEILAFADIGDFAFKPVRTYSDGMFLRLAFSVAVFIEPDILIVDEALSVGDFIFRGKCFKRFEELKRKGTTILYVTHDIDSVRKFCTRAIWLEKGRLMMDGDVADVTSAYMEYAINGSIDREKYGMINRFGTDVGAISKLNCNSEWQTDTMVEVEVEYTCPDRANAENFGVSLAIKNMEGLDLLVLRTERKELTKSNKVKFKFKNQL